MRGFLLGVLLTMPATLTASDALPTVVVCDCSSLPATTAPMTVTLTGHCDGENFTRENALTGVVFPKPQLAWTFQDLPADRNCYFKVPDLVISGTTYHGRNLFVGATVVPTPTPTPIPTPLPSGPLAITSPVPAAVVSGVVSVVVTAPSAAAGQSIRLELQQTTGVLVRSKNEIAVVGVPSQTIPFDVTNVPSGPYQVVALMGTLVSAPVPVTIGGFGPTQTPTPMQDLNAIVLKLDQIISLITPPVPVPPPATADCTVTAVNSASVTCRTQRVFFPSATVGQVLKVIK